jgi:hypothetical protein
MNEAEKTILAPIFERVAEKTGLSISEIRAAVLGEPPS